MRRQKGPDMQKTVMIRPMSREDLPQVLRIENANFPDPWSERIFLDSMALDFYIFLVAEVRETSAVAGYASLMDAAGEGNIMNIAVDEPFRRQGLGGMLLDELIRMGKMRNISAFTLEVRVSNAPAISLYEQKGFLTEGVRKGYYEHPREDALIMWRREDKR